MVLSDKSQGIIKFVARVVIYTLLGISVLKSNPFGISEKTDEATQNAFYKIVSSFYPNHAAEKIVVVLVNSRVIDNLYDNKLIKANEWPILYQDHAFLLSRVMKYRPRSLFVDIYFKKERSTDSSYPVFEQRLKRFSEKYGTELYFAKGYYDEQLSTLQTKLSTIGQLAINGWQGYGHNYPIQVEGQNSIAYQLYRDACINGAPYAACAAVPLSDKELARDAAMSVRWGDLLTTSSGSDIVERDACAEAASKDSMERFYSRLISGYIFEDSDADLSCPYHNTLYADQIIYLDKYGTPQQKSALTKMLGDAVILYALDLEGLHDSIASPVHGLLPGVYFHAMALDNLITHGGNYTKVSDDYLDTVNKIVWFFIVFVVAFVQHRYERARAKANAETGQIKRSLFCEMISGFIQCHTLVIFLLGLSLVIGLSVVVFLFFNYEPINATGYLGLVIILTALITSGLIKKLHLLYDKISTWILKSTNKQV